MLKLKKILLLTFIMLTFFTPVTALNIDMDLKDHDYQFLTIRSIIYEKKIDYDKYCYNTYYRNEIEHYHDYYKKYSLTHVSCATDSMGFENIVPEIQGKNFKTESSLNNQDNNSLNIGINDNFTVANHMEIDMLCNSAHTSKFNCIVKDNKKNWNYEIISKPDYGKIKINSDGTFTYIPYINFCGSDSFSYVLSDGKHKSNITTLIINVNRNNVSDN